MLFRIYLVVSFFSGGLLLAQAKISNSERESIGKVQNKSDEKAVKSNREKAIDKNLIILEKNIAEKVANLEQLQAQAVEFNISLEKEMFLINEKTTSVGRDRVLISRHIEYEFESGNKIKEIRIVSKHKSLVNDLFSVVKVISFSPGNLESIKVTVDKFDSRVKGISEVENYKDFYPEVKLRALKAIDGNLYTTIFRLDTFIQKNQISKIEKNKNLLDGL